MNIRNAWQIFKVYNYKQYKKEEYENRNNLSTHVVEPFVKISIQYWGPRKVHTYKFML